MKEATFSYSDSLVPSKFIKESVKSLESQIKKLKSLSVKDPESAINLAIDKNLHKQIHEIKRKILKYNPKYLVLVGIGGSNLGTMAIQQFVAGKLYNETTNNIKVLYADTVDSDEIAEISQIVEKALKNRERVLINAVSKSGTTIETIANFEVILELVSKYDKKYRELVVITTDEGSPLHNLAKKEGFHVLTIPKSIGGRFSVLSAVGLFPLAILGVNIDELIRGASAMRSRCLKDSSPAVLSAATRLYHMKHGKVIQDMFLFGNDFKSLGKWYRQLFAESLGKGCDLEGKVCLGLTPTYSIGSTDMHSIAQLYLGGPFDKFTTFVYAKSKSNIKVPKYKNYNNLVKNIQSKSLNSIMDAIYSGVKMSFKEKNRPYTEVLLADKSEYSIGQFIQFQIMEVIYLGSLLGINVFDQPDIESYKKETRKKLAK